MYVVEMIVQITFVPDYVIPETFLPEVKRNRDRMGFFEVECVIAFDTMQYAREIAAFTVYSHQPVEVIRQDNVSQKAKGVNCLNTPHGIPEQFDIIRRFEIWFAIMGNHGDEYNSVRNVIPSKVGHFVSLLVSIPAPTTASRPISRRLWKAALLLLPAPHTP